MIQSLGIFGASFDPPHLGHKALVEAALDELGLDEIWVIPVGVPVHKQLSCKVSAQTRLAWVTRMFEDTPKVRVLDWEVRRAQPTATIESMRKVCEQVDVVPVYLMGMDAWQGFSDWIAYDAYHKLCNMAVFPRKHEVMIAYKNWLQVHDASKLLCAQAGHVYVAQTILPDISATQVRKDILTGQDVSSMLDMKLISDIKMAYQ